MTAWYRIQDADRDPSALLDTATWRSVPWYDASVTCDKCHGAGTCYDEDGREIWRCQYCDGKSWYNLCDKPRYGVSVCRDIDDLIDYARNHHMYLDDCVIVEIEGDLADEDDFDDDAFLIHPTRVVSTMPVTEIDELAELLEAC